MTEANEMVARRIVDFYTMLNNRYDERRYSPEWSLLIERVQSRYAELKRHLSFSDANEEAMREAITSILDASLKD